jgi:hypothetical protein
MAEQVDPMDILRRALRAPKEGHERSLTELREHRDAIVEALQLGDQDLDLDEELDPAWVETIGTLLEQSGTGEEVPTSEGFGPIAPLQSREEEESELGYRFARMLESLPWALQHFSALEGLPAVDSEESKRLMESPASANAGKFGRRLASYGLSPLTFNYAAQAVARSLRKEARRRRHSLPPSKVATLEQIAQIATFCRLEADAARRLLAWLQAAAAHAPDIIPGFVARSSEDRKLFFARNAEALDRHFPSMGETPAQAQPLSSFAEE